MTVTAPDVAAELRARLPGLGRLKLHKMLYYCQGHHLATFGEPLFGETISAWDHGPVVGPLWKREKEGEVPTGRAPMTEAELNTVGYVVSRYGKMTGRELEILTHGETPWRSADVGRHPGTAARIEPEWIREHFVAAEVADREDDPVFDSEAVAALLAGVERRRRELSADPDKVEDILAWASRG